MKADASLTLDRVKPGEMRGASHKLIPLMSRTGESLYPLDSIQ